jgi:hypothetical protein
MHTILSKAVLDKAFRVSLLSNKAIQKTELLKIMQIDLEKIVTYPEIKSFVWGNIYSTLFIIFLIAYLFGFAGFLGIVTLIITLSIRLCFKRTIDHYDEELGI